MATNYRNYMYYHLLNLINHYGPISRTELAAYTEYRCGTVGEIVKKQIDEGVVSEHGSLSVGHGRSRTLLQINHDNLHVVSIAVTNNRVTVALIQHHGVTLEQLTKKRTEEDSHESTIENTVQMVDKILSHHESRRIVGIGIAIPTYNPYRHEHEYLADNFEHYNDWLKHDMKSRLEERFKLSIYIYSPIGLPSSAEHYFNRSSKIRFSINVELGNGIGSSIFCNGSVLWGAKNFAGHLGHTVIDISGAENVVCTCGKTGCVEATSSWIAIKASLQQAIDSGAYSLLLPVIRAKGDFLAEDVGRCIEKGDALCKHYVRQAAERIGAAVANMVNLINPEKVTFDGFMLEFGEYFKYQLREAVLNNTLSLCRDIQIEFLENLENKFTLGVAAEVFSAFLRCSEFQWIYTSDTDTPPPVF